jgi:glycerol-3-phosphate dehydrogenase (NAD(P)+)
MRVSIIGAGSFGTALAQTISSYTDEVSLFGRNVELLRSINANHVNPSYHPFTKLNNNIRAFDLSRHAGTLKESDLVVFSIPSGATRDVTYAVKDYLQGKTIVSAAKGIECPSLSTMSEVIKDEAGDVQTASFSGATFADELMQGAFSCATLGINQRADSELIFKAFNAPNLVLDMSNDVQGVELCGILKNVYAIATGIFDATVTGNNPHYGFLSLCFKEMGQILAKISSDPNLAQKFCAHGDLHLTANVDKSRNRILGFIVGKLGITPKDIRSNVVLEGVHAARALKRKSELAEVDTPLITFVNACLDDPARVRDYVKMLIQATSESIPKADLP